MNKIDRAGAGEERVLRVIAARLSRAVVRSAPMYVYKTVGNFAAMMTRYITQALREGLRGWGGYRPVTGPPPARRRTLADPLNREEYLMQLAGRATAASAEQAESSGAR